MTFLLPKDWVWCIGLTHIFTFLAGEVEAWGVWGQGAAVGPSKWLDRLGARPDTYSARTSPLRWKSKRDNKGWSVAVIQWKRLWWIGLLWSKLLLSMSYLSKVHSWLRCSRQCIPLLRTPRVLSAMSRRSPPTAKHWCWGPSTSWNDTILEGRMHGSLVQTSAEADKWTGRKDND